MGVTVLGIQHNFYPRSPCGERREVTPELAHQIGISIHALLAESDRCLRCCAISCITISIHALLAESDKMHALELADAMLFLSTLSLRRATLPTDSLFFLIRHFYPRSPCGERPVTRVARTPTTVISIHALLAESDLSQSSAQSTPEEISIHALLAESDSIGTLRTVSVKNFYPRSPCGERPRKGQSSGAGISISIHALLAESDQSLFADEMSS